MLSLNFPWNAKASGHMIVYQSGKLTNYPYKFFPAHDLQFFFFIFFNFVPQSTDVDWKLADTLWLAQTDLYGIW